MSERDKTKDLIKARLQELGLPGEVLTIGCGRRGCPDCGGTDDTKKLAELITGLAAGRTAPAGD